MSARLGPTACLSLLEAANSDVVIYGSSARINSTLEEVARERPSVLLLPILTREEFDKPDTPAQPPFVREIADRDAEHGELAMMAHSSGSTGLPKPLLLSHRGVMNSLVSGTGLKAFNTLPWYHIHGLITSLQAMWMRRPAHLFNPHLPLTAANLVAALREIQPEICHGVPYTLSLIAEDAAGVEVLKKCRYVTSAGAKTPDELGDKLVKAGVNLGVLYGLSEVGHVGDSIGRGPGQSESWAYMRPYGNVREHMLFKHVDGDNYETVFLKSHPALLMSNSNDPPGSYHTNDLFTPHPTIPDAWKYVARQDDRVTLITGEKILPLAMEGAVRGHPLVKDALMFGNDRALPGMLVFRAKDAAGMTEDEFLKAIWPSVEQANSIADEFARITRETVSSIAYGVDYPATDKGNIVRAAAYALFATQIDAIYARLDGSSSTDNSASLPKPEGQLDEAKLTAFIMDTFKTQTGIDLPTAQTDFFASGVDSLRAIQARRIFQETLGFGGFKLPTNVVYDSRNAANLAHFFYGLLQGTTDHANGANGTNGTVTEKDPLAIMADLASKYATFDTEVPAQYVGSESVLLTGSTGALGAHILFQLLHDDRVERVTCLVRGPHGLKRVLESLEARGLSVSSRKLTRVAVLETSNMGAEYLGLSPHDYYSLVPNTTVIIHAAWPVHFGLSASSFEPHIAGLRNLLQLSLQVPSRHPARVIFASSISAAFNVPRPASGEPASIAEGPLQSYTDSSPMGYAQSKFVGERICEAAARRGANVAVLRIGQITGDTEHGIWNVSEAIPLLVNSALELKALPLLGQEIGRCEWTPVDVVAAACIEIAESMKGGSAVDGVNGSNGVTGGDSSVKARYYNINTSHVLSWNDDVLPELRNAGLEFEAVSLDKWLEKLRSRGEELGAKAAKRLPALKLADYYAESFADSDIVGVRFEIAKACRDSPTLGSCPNIAETQLVRKYLQSWLKAWSKN